MRVQTVIINLAFNLDTSNVRIAFIAIFASTNRVMVDYATEGMFTTGTRIFTYLIDARISIRAFIVSGASCNDGGQSFTSAIVISDIAVRTAANHSSNRQGVNNGTGGNSSAGIQGLAEQGTFVAEATMALGTILIFNTFRLRDGNTGNEWVAGVTWRTSAVRPVICHEAISIAGARVLIQAGIDTILAAAGTVVRTFGIRSAADDFTGYKWITLIAWYTTAVGLVAGWIAFSKSAARVINQTGIDTFSVDTSFSVTALIIALASNGFTGNQWIADVSRWAGTHWSVVLDKTLGICAAITRIHTLSVDAGFAIGTIVISGASRWIWQLYRYTAGVGVRHPALATSTDHCTEWQAVDNGTNG